MLALGALVALTLGHAGALDLNVDSFVPDADRWLVGTFEMIRERRMFGAMAYLSLIILFAFWVKSVIEGWGTRNMMMIGKSTFLSVIVAAIITTAVAPGNVTNEVYRLPIDAWVSVYRMSTKGLAKDIKDGITKDTVELAQAMQEFTTNSFMGLGTMSNIVGGSLYGTAVQSTGTTLDTGSTAVQQVWDEQNEFYKTQRTKLEGMSWAFQIGYLILMGFFLAFAGVIYLSGASVVLALFMFLPALAFWAGGRGRGLTIVLGSMLGAIATVTILPTIMLVVTSLALSQPTKTLKLAVDKQNIEAQAAVTLYANNMIKCAGDAAAAAGKIVNAPVVGPIASQFKVMNRGMCVLSSNAPVVFAEIGRVLMRVIMGLAVMVISMIVGVAIGAAVIRLVPSYIQSVFEGGPTGSDNTSVGSIGRTAMQAGAAVGAITAGIAAPLANGAMRAVGGTDRGITAGNQMLGQKMADNREASAAVAGGGMGGGAMTGGGAGSAGGNPAGAAGGAANSAGAAAAMGGAGASGISGQAFGAAGGPSVGASGSKGVAGGGNAVAGSSTPAVGGGSAVAASTSAGGGGAVGGTASSSGQTTPGPKPVGATASGTSTGGAGSVTSVPGAPAAIGNTGNVKSTNNPAPSAVAAGSSAGNTASVGTGTTGATSQSTASGPVPVGTPGSSGTVSSSGNVVSTGAAPASATGPRAMPAGEAGGAASVGGAGTATSVNTGKAGPGVVPGETSSKPINEAGAAALPGTPGEQQSVKTQKAEKLKEIREVRQARQDAKTPPTATALLKRDAIKAGKSALGAGAAAGGRVANNANRNMQAAKATGKHNDANGDAKMTVPEMRQQMERNGDFDRNRNDAAVRNVTAAHNAAEDRKAGGDASYVKQPITTDQARDTLSRSGNLPHQQAGNTYRTEETRKAHATAEASRQAADPNYKPTGMTAEQAQSVNAQKGYTVQAEEAKARS